MLFFFIPVRIVAATDGVYQADICQKAVRLLYSLSAAPLYPHIFSLYFPLYYMQGGKKWGLSYFCKAVPFELYVVFDNIFVAFAFNNQPCLAVFYHNNGRAGDSVVIGSHRVVISTC